MLVRSLRTRVRMLTGSLVAALSLSVVPFTVDSAQADDVLPFAPWSSYLPGWTDQYVPTSANDCVAGKPTCLKATLKEMARIADDSARACGHEAIFARAYLRMTQLYGYTREIPGYYEDLPSFNHLDSVFAKYYFDAYNNWKNGNRGVVPQSWLIALDAAKNKQVSGSGDLLLGMNAHINRDLAFVLAASGLVRPDGTSIKGDYDAAEIWLFDAVDPLLAEFAQRFDPTTDDSNDPLGVAYWTTFQVVSGWREQAWRNAELLVSAPTPAARALVAASIEANANAIAAGIVQGTSYMPPFSSTTARDAYCAVHKGDTPSTPYDFGIARPYGYSY